MALRVAALAATLVLGVSLVFAAFRGPVATAPPVVAGPRVVGPTIAAAGDIACAPESPAFNGGTGERNRCRQRATSDLLLARHVGVLALGDLQYEDGSNARFLESYDASWGRVKAITAPVPGNHEYRTRGATGYFRYFGRSARDPGKGYYSFDLGRWHLVALNSNCAAVAGCGAGSPQETWLRADLAASRARCTLAYWHHPRYSSGVHGSDRSYRAFWQALYDAGADLVLVGHDHDYERFAPQDANGRRDVARGLRQFVVGTGGHSLRTFPRIEPNSEARDSSTFGVLELTLGAGAYAWRFRPAVGTFTDEGSARCHREPTSVGRGRP
ncbi:MAG: Alkaline phosphatase [Gaiellaceae bacterium]|nr:Alkaline phosphatase [Gaiellaceae bacterium]